MGIKTFDLAVVLTALLSAAAPASAAADPEALRGGAAIDWDRGWLSAPGSAAADLRAPSAEIARIKAERQARERAEQRLTEGLRALPRGRWDGAPPDEQALAQAIGKAETQDVVYGANGSVTLRLRLPLKALPVVLSPPGRGKRHKREAAP